MIDETGYRSFLASQGLGENGINSRVSLLKRAESELGINAEDAVSSDLHMLGALERIHGSDGDHNGNMANALRKYYQFRNGRECPTVSELKGN
jgi:hypothetical protein